MADFRADPGIAAARGLKTSLANGPGNEAFLDHMALQSKGKCLEFKELIKSLRLGSLRSERDVP